MDAGRDLTNSRRLGRQSAYPCAIISWAVPHRAARRVVACGCILLRLSQHPNIPWHLHRTLRVLAGKDARWMRSQIICPRLPDAVRRSDLLFSLQLVCCSNSVLSYLSSLDQFCSCSDHAMWDKTSFLLFYATILVARKTAATQILGMSISAR